MPNNIIMADAKGGNEINGSHFTVKRIVVHVPADNGVTSTQGAVNYMFQLIGKTSFSQRNQIPYFRYVDDPTPVLYLVRSIGPNNVVSRCSDASTGKYSNTAVGTAYSAVLAEGDVEICYLEVTQ